MEVKGATLLYTLAGLMVTFAGFFALLLSLRQSIGVRMSHLDRLLAKTVVTHLFLLTGGALLPPLLALYGIPENLVWKIAAVLFAVPMLSRLLTYPRRRRRAADQGPSLAILAVFVVLGSAALVAMLVYVFGDFRYNAAAYITALMVNFFTLAFIFVVALDFILKQPHDQS